MPVHVAPDPDTLANHSADLIADLVGSAGDGRVSLGLAGGSTPQATYRQLRWTSIDWRNVDVWLSDERWVPHDHPDSNGRAALESIGPDPAIGLLRPRWSTHMTADDSAAFYEATLREIIPSGEADVVLLGLGDDGHTASLFPGTEALDERERWFVGNHVPQLDTWRLTTTAPFLQHAHHLVIIVRGEDKAPILREVLEGPDGRYPIQLVRHATGEVWWLLDRAAASELESTEVEVVGDRPGLR